MLGHLLLALLIGITSNIDNVGIGLSYGLRRTHVPIMFCCAAFGTSFFACLVGGLTSNRIAGVISPAICKDIGMAILIFVGLWILIQWFIFSNDVAEIHPSVGFSELMFMALAQGLTDLSIGFASGFARLNPLEVSISVGFFSALFLIAPSRLALRLVPARFTRGATFLSGLLLIIIALWL